MMTRQYALRRLLDDLSSPDESVVQVAVDRSVYLLEKHVPKRNRETEETRRFYHERLGDEYDLVAPSREEIDAIVQALLQILDGPAAIAGRAAFALSRSARVQALPGLADVLRRRAPSDGWVARQVIIAISDIILATTNPKQPLKPEEERAIRQACEALQFASLHAVQDINGARSLALQERESITTHLEEPF